MGTHSPTPKRLAFTLIELLVVVAIIAVFIAMLIPAHTSNGHGYRAMCMNYQRQIGVALANFNIDHGGHYPWQLSITNGGSMDSLPDGHVFPHFRVLTDYLKLDTHIFICPADKERLLATNLPALLDEKISYFLNVDVVTKNPTTLVIIGDRNMLADGRPVTPGLFALSTNLDLNWNREALHHSGGILAFADGHVQFVKTNALNDILRDPAMATNRLCVP